MEKDKYESFWNDVLPHALKKLQENESKGNLEIDLFYAEKRIGDEKKEIRRELYDLFDRNHRDIEEIDLEAARDEFADVMNFAAMGVRECNRLIRWREKNKKKVANKGKG